MDNLGHLSVQPTFKDLDTDLSLAITTSLSSKDLSTKNIAQETFEKLSSSYKDQAQKEGLDSTQKKIAKNWQQSARTSLKEVGSEQVLLTAQQTVLHDKAVSLLNEVRGSQKKWENPSFFRRVFQNVEQNRQESLQKLHHKTTPLLKQVTTFSQEVTISQKKVSDTATKIQVSLESCKKQISLYGKARDTQGETSVLLASTKSQLSRYSSETQKTLQPKLRQLEALQERLGQVKEKWSQGGLPLDKQVVANAADKEMEHLSNMQDRLKKEIDDTLHNSPQLSITEKIGHFFQSTFSIESTKTLSLQKAALLTALEPPQVGQGPAESGRSLIFSGRRASSQELPANTINKTLSTKEGREATVEALQLLLPRCEVEPNNARAKKMLCTLLDAIQSHAIRDTIVRQIFDENPSLRNRIIALQPYSLSEKEMAFIDKQDSTLKEKIQLMDKDIRLWQLQESTFTPLVNNKLKEIQQDVLTIDISLKLTGKTDNILKEIQSTENTFLQSLKDYRTLLQTLMEEKGVPENIKRICQESIETIGTKPHSFLESAPLLEGTADLTGSALMKKTLENFSSSAMETQSEALGRLSKKKFINDGGTIAAYLNKEENSAIRDHLTQAGFEPSQVTALAIVGVQRSPRYELLLESLNDADNKTNNGALSSIFTNLIDVYKFRGFIINKNSGG